MLDLMLSGFAHIFQLYLPALCLTRHIFFYKENRLCTLGGKLIISPKNCSVIFSAVRNVIHPGTATKHGRLPPFSSHELVLLHQEYLFLRFLAQSSLQTCTEASRNTTWSSAWPSPRSSSASETLNSDGLSLSEILLIFWPSFGWCFKGISAREAEHANFCPSSALWVILQGHADIGVHTVICLGCSSFYTA